ncbi:MAG TPA: M23 family metallopeptidase [Gemmatimonadales bacterium]|nr:M23 family metallopeptidase [Gemmatimonadales bacterium]
MPIRCAGLAFLLPLAGTVATAASAQSPAVRWLGDPPVSGGIQWLEVAVPGAAADSVTGRFDGAPVAFFQVGESWIAAAAVRVATRTAASATITIHRGNTRSVLIRSLPVTGRGFRSSRLTVARQFTETPRGELAERIALERELVAPLGGEALATPRLFDAPFVRPGAGVITDEFGVARVLNRSVRSRHYGVDFDGRVGDEVRAANRGVVMLVDDLYYSGTSIYLNHGAGLITAYFHLSEALVSVGDTVTAGQLIGRIGATGRVTGPHLHWMVRVGDRPVDGGTLLVLPPPGVGGWGAGARGSQGANP